MPTSRLLQAHSMMTFYGPGDVTALNQSMASTQMTFLRNWPAFYSQHHKEQCESYLNSGSQRMVLLNYQESEARPGGGAPVLALQLR